MTVEKAFLAWSGGKDSAHALHRLRLKGDLRVEALLTTVTREYDRISMHGVRRELLEAQARSIDLPLVVVEIPAKGGQRFVRIRHETSHGQPRSTGIHNGGFRGYLSRRCPTLQDKSPPGFRPYPVFSALGNRQPPSGRRLHRRRIQSPTFLRGYRTDRRCVRRSFVRPGFASRSAGKSRSLWGKRRISQFCNRWTHFSAAFERPMR